MAAGGERRTAKGYTPDEAAVIVSNARSCVVVPGYGMAVAQADRAQHVFVIKRSMNPGFAGVQNPLFFNDSTMMVFGDAKGAVLKIVEAIKNLA